MDGGRFTLVLVVSPGAGSVTVGANSEERAYLSSFTIQDVDISGEDRSPKCMAATNCDAFVLGRYTPAYNPTYYRVGLVKGLAGLTFSFARSAVMAPAWAVISIPACLPPMGHGLATCRVPGSEPYRSARPRLAGWDAEPSTWLLNTTDSTSAEQKAGMVGLRLRNEDTSASHTFQVESYQANGSAIPVSVTPNPSGSARHTSCMWWTRHDLRLRH